MTRRCVGSRTHDFDGAVCLHCGAVDLTLAVGVDECEAVARALRRVVEASAPLALDSESDRETLLRRLRLALGFTS